MNTTEVDLDFVHDCVPIRQIIENFPYNGIKRCNFALEMNYIFEK